MNNDWGINPNELFQYKKNHLEPDCFLKTKDGCYGIVVYNTREYRMCATNGLFAIYETKNSTEPIVNLKNYKIWYRGNYTFNYAPLSKCIILYVNTGTIDTAVNGIPASQTPFLFIDLEKKRYFILPWDHTSIDYGWKEISKNHLQLYETLPAAHYEKNKNSFQEGEILNLDDLDWNNIE